MKNENKDEQSKLNIRLIVRIVCAAGFLCCIGWFIYYFVSMRNSDAQVDSLRNKYVAKTAAESLSEETFPEEEETEPANLFGGVEYDTTENYDVPELILDFEGMQEECADIYAWLYVPDTRIDHPILQREDEAEF